MSLKQLDRELRLFAKDAWDATPWALIKEVEIYRNRKKKQVSRK